MSTLFDHSDGAHLAEQALREMGTLARRLSVSQSLPSVFTTAQASVHNSQPAQRKTKQLDPTHTARLTT